MSSSSSSVSSESIIDDREDQNELVCLARTLSNNDGAGTIRNPKRFGIVNFEKSSSKSASPLKAELQLQHESDAAIRSPNQSLSDLNVRTIEEEEDLYDTLRYDPFNVPATTNQDTSKIISENALPERSFRILKQVRFTDSDEILKNFGNSNPPKSSPISVKKVKRSKRHFFFKSRKARHRDLEDPSSSEYSATPDTSEFNSPNKSSTYEIPNGKNVSGFKSQERFEGSSKIQPKPNQNQASYQIIPEIIEELDKNLNNSMDLDEEYDVGDDNDDKQLRIVSTIPPSTSPNTIFSADNQTSTELSSKSNDIDNLYSSDYRSSQFEDSALSLAKRFSNLKLDQQDESMRDADTDAINTFKNIQSKFSLRLSKDHFESLKKGQFEETTQDITLNGLSNASFNFGKADSYTLNPSTPDGSFDQVDILDRDPLKLPDIQGIPSTNIKIGNLKSIPIFDETEEKFDYAATKLKCRDILLSLESNKNSTNGSRQSSLENLGNYTLDDLLSRCGKLIIENSATMEHERRQSINYRKKFEDLAISLDEIGSESVLKTQKIEDLQKQLIEIQTQRDKLENKFKREQQTLLYERERYSDLERDLFNQRSLLNHLQFKQKQRESFNSKLSNLIIPGTSAEDMNNEEAVLESLTGFINSTKILKERNQLLIMNENQLHKELKNLKDINENSFEEKTALQNSLLEKETLILEYVEEIKTHTLKIQALERSCNEAGAISTLKQSENKRLQNEISDSKKDIERMELRMKELEKNIEVLNSNKIKLESTVIQLQHIGDEQINWLKDRDSKITLQENSLIESQDKIVNLMLEKDGCVKDLENLRDVVEGLRLQIKESKELLDLRNEEQISLTEKFQQAQESKDLKIAELQKGISTKDDIIDEIDVNLKETRRKLGEKHDQCVWYERRLDQLRSELDESSSELNRRINCTQGLKRSYLDLCYNALNNFEGIMDPFSLETIKEIIEHEELDGEKCFQSILKINLYVRESITVLTKGYRNLMKSIENSQKEVIPHTRLQQEIEEQTIKITKLSEKVKKYEDFIKKIPRKKTTSGNNDIQSSSFRRPNLKPGSSSTLMSDDLFKLIS
ncbi:hypothetical protein WICMUC_005106 [Wickerhamomyces mucosus]|uniref:Uncharacterized protein n=1 Tax=Wickerhamomyces mucosus TaxID=1378264 RepID=A0A9P8T7P4_9ASCO|nr:hypothetical protein WICMUC_005106 [Wickerhamomyces mucosus]